MARKPSGIDSSIEEYLTDCFDEVISGEGAKCSCEQWGRGACSEPIEEGLEGSHWACRGCGWGSGEWDSDTLAKVVCFGGGKSEDDIAVFENDG